MVEIEEMEGTPQKGLTLSRTIDSIVSVVRQSRGEPAQTPEDRQVTAGELKDLFHSDLERRPDTEGSETQERIDLDSLRRALYDS